MTLSFVESLGISLLGFSIVFFVLAVLMAVIRVLRLAVDKFENAAPAVETETPPPVAMPSPTETMVLAKGSSGEVCLYDVDNKTAAIIMAIVANKTNIPLNELRFISIKEKSLKGTDSL